MSRWLLVGWSGCLACASAEPSDPLDRDVIDDIAIAQGSASGTEWSGTYIATYATQSCDCPTIEIDGGEVELCDLAGVDASVLELTQADGFLLVPIGSGMLSGAVEDDGTVSLGGVQDVSSQLGMGSLLGRVDGSLELVGGEARLVGEVGQRLVADLGDESIDCRWLGSVEATRQ